MGNTPNTSSTSSLIVEHTRNNSLMNKNWPITLESDKRSHSNNPHKKSNHPQQKNSPFDHKLKIVSGNRTKIGAVSQNKLKVKNSIYFSVKGLQNHAQKYKAKEKIKINKSKSRCSTTEKPYIFNSVGIYEKKQSKPQIQIHQNAKLFKQASRQPFLTPGGSASKRKAISIKQSSLNKSPRNIKTQKKFENVSIDPYRLSQNQIETKNYYPQTEKINQQEKFEQMKTAKSKQKITSVHEFYFQKCGSKPQVGPTRIKTQNENYQSTLYIPIENHKNPMGKQKLILAQKRQKKTQKIIENVNPLERSLGIQSVKCNDKDQKYPEVLGLETKKIAEREVIKDKQYSICEDSAQNLSKISIKQIESEIRLEQSEVRPTSINFVFDESIIIRGNEQQMIQN